MRPEAAAQVLNCWQAAADPFRPSRIELFDPVNISGKSV